MGEGASGRAGVWLTAAGRRWSGVSRVSAWRGARGSSRAMQTGGTGTSTAFESGNTAYASPSAARGHVKLSGIVKLLGPSQETAMHPGRGPPTEHGLYDGEDEMQGTGPSRTAPGHANTRSSSSSQSPRRGDCPGTTRLKSRQTLWVPIPR